MMQVLGIRATLFDFLEHQACEEDKTKGLDIADYLLKIKPAEAKLQALIKQNPAIRKLIDVFKLEIVDEPQPRFRTPKRQRGFRLWDDLKIEVSDDSKLCLSYSKPFELLSKALAYR